MVVVTKGSDPATDLARPREGELNLHDSIAYVFLPDGKVDALLARLASEPVRPADLAADHPSDGRRLLRLRKFDLVEFRSATGRTAS